jgi:hypothetical protein
MNHDQYVCHILLSFILNTAIHFVWNISVFMLTVAIIVAKIVCDKFNIVKVGTVENYANRLFTKL